ncbi:hypothetical protein R69927_06584 [Paraburkholderia domus]|jgi:hypothetical protein|uniref:Uncharacterized protein n=1 Tax=Paraburkholderia domus TaxID=2793075 RepID=A0A9N8MTU7_9BURK|nr:hypothetical protein [Paraburkholderia domus]MBK5051265.1 hypothetical protein [Burkholderia sp. R-70006]MBK5061237.1 hypothetical protein [Burkholderia sp. R-70199]MBK5090677.1 hypothetical protein [Burkholderia sp. R-69927]MBK5121034.1 hypothetical protein [Burkholderia sp. R-69980]MBK5166432.1 hypothetical protein [Burkholderia sp. R-70211]MBK5185027.1 hypothetical protein [Burkholderia sp. R-69749]MCI0146586.1 hypothetical protein [Paraburkholderia sediminicola]
MKKQTFAQILWLSLAQSGTRMSTPPWFDAWLLRRAHRTIRLPHGPEYWQGLHDSHALCGAVSSAHTRWRYDAPALRRIFNRLTLASLIGVLAGCSDGISQTDVEFVAAAMPAQFESLRMYKTAPDNVAPIGSAAHAPVQLQQGCEAIIQTAGGHKREIVILDSRSAASFDLDAVRTSSGWSVTSDGLAPPADNPVGFRTQFSSCVSALVDKYRSEPEKAPFGAQPATALH